MENGDGRTELSGAVGADADGDAGADADGDAEAEEDGCGNAQAGPPVPSRRVVAAHGFNRSASTAATNPSLITERFVRFRFECRG